MGPLRARSENEVINDQQDDGSDHPSDEPRALPGLIPAEEVANVRGEERPGDAEGSGQEETARPGAGSQQFRNQPCDEPIKMVQMMCIRFPPRLDARRQRNSASFPYLSASR